MTLSPFYLNHMKNIFNSVKIKTPAQSLFDLTHDVKLTANFGSLYPVCNVECLPGDKFDIANETLVRMAPMVAPVLQRMDVFIHYFFVPNRLVWPDFYKWLMQGDDALVHPYIEHDYSYYTNLLSYMGIPEIPGTNTFKYHLNGLPFAAYQAIWNDYYRDQNLQTEIDYKLVSGNNTAARSKWWAMRNRAYEHDYFTSALPFAQKGDSVIVPFEDAPIKFAGAEPRGLGVTYSVTDTTTGPRTASAANGDPSWGAVPSDIMYADMSSSAGTINNLRRAYALQRWLETNARGGTRNVEAILSHFDVKSKDSRLQRPEYICGSKTPLTISEVLNTTGEDGGLPQGNMAGHGIGAINSNMGHYFCQEHGWIIGVMSILPRTSYAQGIHKSFVKSDPTDDYAWPEFANIGEQPVQNFELYAGVNDGSEDPTGAFGTFGYVPRYAEYKFMNSRVAGDFVYGGSLDYWHLSRQFTNLPALAEEFITCDGGDDQNLYRIFAVTDPNVDHFYIHHLNKLRAVRKLPKYGTPM